jgi:triphosphatase
MSTRVQSGAPAPAIEMICSTEVALTLPRHAAFGRPRGQRNRYRTVNRTFYDTTGWDLAARDMALIEAAPVWSAETVGRARRQGPGRPVPPSATSIHPAGIEERLGQALPGPLRPFASLHGRLQRLGLSHDGAALECRILSGTLTAVNLHGEITASRSVARIEIEGDLAASLSFAKLIGRDTALTPSLRSLPHEALRLADATLPGRVPLRLDPQMSAAAAFGVLLRDRVSTLLSLLGGIKHDNGEENVHQARVTLRRLRALLLAFRPLLGETEEALKLALGGLKEALGPARDWDVFLAETVGPLAEGLSAEDPAIAWLRQTAEQRRREAYAALLQWLAGDAFRQLAWDLVAVTLGEGWKGEAEAEVPPDLIAEPTLAEAIDAVTSDPEAESLPPPTLPEPASETIEIYARHLIHRRWKKIACPVGEVMALTDAELHKLRIKCKKLRYQTEMFSDVLPSREGRKLIKRLSELQESMGKHNDGIVAAGLARELRPPKPEALADEALGLVRGFGVGGGRSDRGEVLELWRKLLKSGAF